MIRDLENLGLILTSPDIVSCVRIDGNGLSKNDPRCRRVLSYYEDRMGAALPELCMNLGDGV